MTVVAPYHALQDGKHETRDSLLALHDYRCLWGTNVATFCGKILMKMASLQWLYEATGSSMVLGGLGAIQLVTQIPSILFGGVLADELDRRWLVASMQAVAAVVCSVVGVLAFCDMLLPWHIYLSVGCLTVSGRLESSARNSLTPQVVPPHLVQRATSTNVVTDNVGLYLLDWGMTVFTFYRELFPIFAATLLGSRPAWLSLRATVSLLTSFNFAGGVAGSLLTFSMASNPFKGRQVLRATVVYGAFCVAFGASPLWWLCPLAVFGAGASDAVGMTVRKTVVSVAVEKHIQGRASAGHSLAANVANSLGQVYVAAACVWIGAGPSLVLGGFLTWVSVGLAAWRVPALLSYSVAPPAPAAAAAEAAEEGKQ